MADKRLIKTSLNEENKKNFRVKRFFFNALKLFNLCNRDLKSFLSKINHAILGSKGVAAILVVISLPLITWGISYLIKYTQKSNFETGNHEVPYIIAKNVAKAFNPGRTWSEQKDYLYSTAAQTYNDGAYNSGKSMPFALDKVYKAKISKKTFSNVFLLDFYAERILLARRESPNSFIDKGILAECPPFSNAVYNEASSSMSLNYLDESGSGENVYIISKYKENSKLALSLNSDGTIKVECPELKKAAEVTVPRNDVDIIIAIPTNHASNTTSNDNTASFGDYSNSSTADSTPIKQIARACQAFLKPFLHTAGVAVGLVPYSGKVTLSPYMSELLTIETPMNINPDGGLTYAMQAMFYGSDGKAGGDLVLRSGEEDYGIYDDWGDARYGCPIMARRGQQQSYRNMLLNSGAISYKTLENSLLLDMTTNPIAGDDYKFMRMNTNPCYLGFCNTLAMTCEKNCPTYRANPYFLTELTSDIQGLICDLELLVPFKDDRNKSNFLFLPLVMAGNLFSWGSHPSELSASERVPEKSRSKKVRAVIIIANAPDNFEPMELTYLGFNNDYSEIPMIESDTILFDENRRGFVDQSSGTQKIYKGVKGAVQFSSYDGSLDSKGYLFKANSPTQEMTARISFPNKGLIKIVAERENPATVTVSNNNGVEDNLGTHTFLGSKTLSFRGPQQVYNWADLGTSFSSGNYTTKGPNFGHNTSTKKVKIKFTGCKLNKATLSNQILRFYGTYSPETGKNQIGSRMDPCISFGTGADASSGWVDGTSYIKAYGFSPSCGGVSNLSKFVMAASRLSDNVIVDDSSVGSKGVKYNDSSGKKYRVYSGVSLPFNTGKLEIKNEAYYDSYVSGKQRSRTINQTITTTRTFPDRGNTVTQGTSSDQTSSYNKTPCCSIVWRGYHVPYKKKTGIKCNKITVQKLGSSQTCERMSTGGTCNNITCPSVTYYQGGSLSRDYREATNNVTGETFTYLYQKEVNAAYGSRQGTCKNQDCDCGYRDISPCLRYYENVIYTEHAYNECCAGDTKENDECKHYATTTNGRDIYTHHAYNKCCAGDTIENGECKHYAGTHRTDQCVEWTQKWMCNTCQYCCNYPLVDYEIDTGSDCEKLEYHWEYDNTGYNELAGCTGVCYNSVVTDSTGWTDKGTTKSRSCYGSVPSTTLKESFSRSQTQSTSSCTYSKGSGGSNVNSTCTYPSISIPSVSYSYSSCDDSVSGSSGGSPSASSWNETVTEHSRFYTQYLKDIDGESAGNKCFICDSYGSNCGSAYSCSGYSPSTLDSSKTTKTPYRYLLHNFFFVNGNSISNTYSYSGSYPDYTLTSTVSSESDSNLVNNQGIYLLPTGNENEYWVCFCGDADLTLNFSDATEANIAFSNINPIQYQVDFGDSVTETVGTTGSDIDMKQIFYIHPDQIKDTFDENGNYFVDLKLKGQPRILSIEITNRPLKSEYLSEYDNGEIVGKDSSGGKTIGNSETTIELKLPQKSAYTFTAQPLSFWIDGQGDFRQTSGTVRVCSNTNKTEGIVDVKVPDTGGEEITLTAEQPTRDYKQSDTGVWINEVTPNYTYTISTDRKLKSIKVPSFVAPKVSFSNAVSDQSYIFCAKELGDDFIPRLFDWPLRTFSHATVDNGSGFPNKTCYGKANIVDFELTACKITQATAENLIMQFSPTVNDFSKVTFSNTYGNTILKGLGECINSLNFADDANSSTICGYLNEDEFDCRSGYWLPWASCASGGYYSQRETDMISWQTEMKVDMTDAFDKYGQGTVLLYAYRGDRPLNAEFFAGASNVFYDRDIHTNSAVELKGLCTSSAYANVRMSEVIVDSTHTDFNYLGACYYQVTDPCNLLGSNHLSYSNQDTVNHNYEGTLSFHGIGDIRIYVQPQKVREDDYYTRDMSESELSGSFGNYKYAFSESDYLLNLDDESLTKENNSFELLYNTGKIGTTTINAGNSSNYPVLATTAVGNEYYYTDVNVENVLVTISSSIVSKVDGNTLISSKEGMSKEETFTISPYTHNFEDRGDGYYYVKLKCRNVYIYNLKSVSNIRVYYDHPNIINENLINTRIIDGYDRASSQNMGLYGNMNYNNESLPSVSAVQKLFYNIKANNNVKYFYPIVSGTGAAPKGEEGDFFIQIWDHNYEIPAVRWKIGNTIQSSDSYTVADSGFGAFRSNYAFSGLHRMFFPYNTYNKDFAGYSYALNSALVFAGFTLPINLILANSGYQEVFRVDSGHVKTYTRPNKALENLAKDACTKLKELETDWNGTSVVPMVFLVKYRTSSTLSLEDCASVYTASDEKELTEKMIEISKFIEECSRTNELRVNVKDM